MPNFTRNRFETTEPYRLFSARQYICTARYMLKTNIIYYVVSSAVPFYFLTRNRCHVATHLALGLAVVCVGVTSSKKRILRRFKSD